MTPPCKIIGFCCEHALNKEKELTGKDWLQSQSTVKVSVLPCSSKADMLALIKAFESGADGVFVLGCREDDCSLVDGCRRAGKLVNYTKRLLDEIGIGGERLEIFHLETPGCECMEQAVGTMVSRIEALEVKGE
ncbi:MAG: hydrogenase iron-sulfur subunit [Thermodesulfobacteriota bacterium]|nr:hydrogenase iron-sulfur subunit [Thermodesulfobacteriota bacterium]